MSELHRQLVSMEGEKNFFHLLSLEKTGKVDLYRKEDPKKLLSWTRKLVALLTRILSIVMNPAIVTSREEEVKRVEVSGPLSEEDFRKTVREPSFWSRKKDGSMVPELVHSTEKIDVDNTYENRFLCMLIDMVDREIHDLIHLFGRREGSLLDYGKDKRLSYEPTDLLSRFDLKVPYLDDRSVIEKEEDVDLLLHQALTYLKRLKNSKFYHDLVLFPIKGQIQATNVLIHHPLYSYCYRFYVDELRKRNEEGKKEEKGYRSFVLLSLLSELAEEGFELTPYGYRVEEGEVRFQCLFARRKNLTLSLYERKDGYLLRSVLLDRENNATLSSSDRLLKVLPLVKEEEVSSLFREVRERKVDDVTLATMSLLEEKRQDHVLVLVPGERASKERMRNYLASLFLLFDEGHSFDYSCPVCHNAHLSKREDGYYCPSCHAFLSVIENRGKVLVWLKGLWRSR